MMGILLYSAISRYCFDAPVIWGVEMAQFTMVVYYILGGGFALLTNSHVRMDVFYGRWKWRKQAKMDVITSVFSGRVPCVAVLRLCFKHVVLHRV